MPPIDLATYAAGITTIRAIQTGWQIYESSQTKLQQDLHAAHQFKFIRSVQKSNRRHLSEIAFRLPSVESGRGAFMHAPLLCQDSWLPKEPILLGTPDEQLDDDTERFQTKATSENFLKRKNSIIDNPEFCERSSEILPKLDQGTESEIKLTDAILAIENPPADLFVSRPSYAFRKVTNKHSQMVLNFGPSTYFDYINYGEILAYETILESLKLHERSTLHDDKEALAKLDSRQLLRKMSGEWNAVSFRPSLAGVNCLTVFRDSQTGQMFFPMMQRSSNTGTASGTKHVIPAGEFQPTTESPVAWHQHCTLWQTIIREFAEEILLVDEARFMGKDMVQLAKLPEVRPLLDLIANGHWQSYFLGLALDPLTLKPELLCLSVIDLKRFRRHSVDHFKMSSLPTSNAEGDILAGPSGWGEELNAENILRFRDNPQTLPAASGCLELLQRHAKLLS